MSDTRNPNVSRAGMGKPGYCKLCSLSDVRSLNKNIAAGWTPRQLNDWMSANYGVTATRQTIYNHKDNHAKRAEDRIVSAVAKMQATPGAMIPRESSPDEFLDAVQYLAHKRAVENPDEVTIDHGLKVAQIKATQKQKGGNTLILLASVSTGGDWRSGVVIEGQATEVSD